MGGNGVGMCVGMWVGKFWTKVIVSKLILTVSI